MSVYEFRHTDSPQAAAAWTRRQIILTDLRSVRGRAYPRITGMLREPSWVFFEILLPFLATSAFVFVYRALQAPPQYIGFVVLGGALTSFWLNVVWMMAGQLYWEKAQGNLELFFAAPMGFMAILFGMALGGMVMSSIRAVVVLLVSTLVYGVTFEVQQPLLLVRDLPPDADRALWPRDDHGQPLSRLGSRGVPAEPALRGAGVLRIRA